MVSLDAYVVATWLNFPVKLLRKTDSFMGNDMAVKLINGWSRLVPLGGLLARDDAAAEVDGSKYVKFPHISRH